MALEAGGLNYSGNVRVRHLLDVIVTDIGYEKIGVAREEEAGGPQGGARTTDARSCAPKRDSTIRTSR